MRLIRPLLSILILTLVCFATIPQATGSVQAQGVALIGYSGYYASASTQLTSTSANVHFAIYNDAQGGSLIWQESHAYISTYQGKFGLTLGMFSRIPPSVFSQPGNYLQVTIGGVPIGARQPVSRYMVAPDYPMQAYYSCNL